MQAILNEYGVLVGRTVVRVRELLAIEALTLGWEPHRCESACVLVFDDGSIAVPAADPEMNGAGFLFLQVAGDDE